MKEGMLGGEDEQAHGLIKKETVAMQANRKARERQNLGDKIFMYLRNAFWAIAAIITIYYSNFFHNFFHNPKINELFFELCVACYTMLIGFIIYSVFVLPLCYGIQSIEDYNPKLIPVGAVIGVVSVISLLIAIWPVWGFTSFLLFIVLWKGFFSLSVFLPGGSFGNFLFFAINIGTVLSFYLIEHEGYFH